MDGTLPRLGSVKCVQNKLSVTKQVVCTSVSYE